MSNYELKSSGSGFAFCLPR